jgi:hypothetical protein
VGFDKLKNRASPRSPNLPTARVAKLADARDLKSNYQFRRHTHLQVFSYGYPRFLTHHVRACAVALRGIATAWDVYSAVEPDPKNTQQDQKLITILPGDESKRAVCAVNYHQDFTELLLNS